MHVGGEVFSLLTKEKAKEIPEIEQDSKSK